MGEGRNRIVVWALRNARPTLFLAALLPRLILPIVHYSGVTSDSVTYLSMARGMLNGVGFVDIEGRPTAKRPPVYPLFLTGMLKMSGNELRGVQIVQAILSAALAPLLFEFLGGRLGRGAAFLAGLLWAFDPVSIPPPAYILTESIGAVLVFLWYLQWTRTLRHSSVRGFLWQGVLGGVLPYQTMITALLHPLAMVATFFHRPRFWKRIFVSLIIMIIPMQLWAWRNRVVLGEETAVRSGGFGFLLWATMQYDFPWLLSPYDPRGAMIFKQEKHVYRHYPLSEQHRIYFRKGRARFFSDPVGGTVRAIKGVFWSWVDVPGAMKSLDRFPIAKAFLRVANIVWLLLALVGMGRAWRVTEGRCAIGVLLYFTFFHMWLYPIPRYFLPVRPLLALLGGFGVGTLFPRK